MKLFSAAGMGAVCVAVVIGFGLGVLKTEEKLVKAQAELASIRANLKKTHCIGVLYTEPDTLESVEPSLR